MQNDVAQLPTERATATAWTARTALSWLLPRLRSCSAGRLTIIWPSGDVSRHEGSRPGPDAHIVLHRWSTLRRLMLAGDLGLAEAYCRKEWSSPDLIAVLSWATINEAALASVWRGSTTTRLLDRVWHLRRANTRAGSRRNIAAHYDLGNDFYAAWLDPGLTYSSALYRTGQETLSAAQDAKIARVIELLRLARGDRVLEVGCGWGALAEAMAGAAPQVHVTGLTLSVEQQDYARQRLHRAGLTQHTDIALIDYRQAAGLYDGIASIEMLEAVGARYWPAYFAKVRSLLRPGRRAVIQAITIDERRFDGYRARPDFIQCYIFPGGMLPTKTLIAEHARQAGLNVVASEAFGSSYATTLRVWRQRFRDADTDLAGFGFDQRFRRMWDYYLAYCETGFRLGALDVGLYVLE